MMIVSKQLQIFFDFLRFCIGSAKEIPDSSKEADWKELYAIAQKQCLVGVLFDGIKKLPAEYVGMKKELLLQWMAESQMLVKANVRLNDAAIQVSEWFRKKGFRTCILKGQGNALMYPNPYSRTPGDIDVWIDASRERIMEYAQKKFELGDDIRLQHLETSLDGVPVELHFFPCSMNNPIYHARLQKWFRRNADLQCSHIVGLPDGAGDIAIPTTAFNVVYQLTHLYHHFFDEGIGMRQIIDYYYVVCDFYKVYQNSSKITPSLFTIKEGSTSHPDPLTLRGEGGNRPTRCSEPLRSKVGGPSKVSPNCAGWDRRGVSGDTGSVSCSSASGSSITSVSSASTTDSSASTALVVVQRELKYLGLWKFAGAVMYVLHEALGLPEEKMIAPMDEKRGKLLLAEILEGGNFGRHFTKYGGFTHQSTGKKYFLKIWRNMHFVRYYPAEALSEPIFRTWHFFWRVKNKK